MQKSLFDLDLRFNGQDTPFEDELERKLARFRWESPPFRNWTYDDNDEAVLITTTMQLHAVRMVDKRGKVHLYLDRQLRSSHVTEPIDDLIGCAHLSELEQIFDNEKDTVEFRIANNVMFDGHRYWWHWEEDSGKVIFTRRFLPGEHEAASAPGAAEPAVIPSTPEEVTVSATAPAQPGPGRTRAAERRI